MCKEGAAARQVATQREREEDKTQKRKRGKKTRKAILVHGQRNRSLAADGPCFAL